MVIVLGPTRGVGRTRAGVGQRLRIETSFANGGNSQFDGSCWRVDGQGALAKLKCERPDAVDAVDRATDL